MHIKTLFLLFILTITAVSAYHSGYDAPKIEGKPGSGLVSAGGRVVYYQNPWPSSGSGVYQKRVGSTGGPAYNPFPMPNTAASGRNGGYSSYIFLDNQLAYNYYSHPELLQPRYMTNNWRYLKALPYSYGVIGPNRDKRAPLLRVSSGERRVYGDQMGYLG